MLLHPKHGPRVSMVLGKLGMCCVSPCPITNEAAFPPQSLHWVLVADTLQHPRAFKPPQWRPVLPCPFQSITFTATAFPCSLLLLPMLLHGVSLQHHLMSPPFPACSCHTLPASTLLQAPNPPAQPLPMPLPSQSPLVHRGPLCHHPSPWCSPGSQHHPPLPNKLCPCLLLGHP